MHWLLVDHMMMASYTKGGPKDVWWLAAGRGSQFVHFEPQSDYLIPDFFLPLKTLWHFRWRWMIQNNNMYMCRNLHIYTYVPRVAAFSLLEPYMKPQLWNNFTFPKVLTTLSNHPKNQPQLLQCRRHKPQRPTREENEAGNFSKNSKGWTVSLDCWLAAVEL